ncbi:MAG: type III pantothenate kinase [Anaerolineae bacterium]|nr:type III pantothenate kinase [Anaerolineae bacterium]
MALLCVDVGNTNIVLGVYEGPALTAHWRIMTDHHRMPDEYGLLLLQMLGLAGKRPADIEGICMCSVVPPLTGIFGEMFERYFQRAPLVVSAGVRTGVRIRVDNPREVGADRIVNAAAGFRKYGGPACIVDFGTATTFDAISEEGDYLGGAIAPGLETALEALVMRTAQLPRIDLSQPPKIIGTNTVESMRSGVFMGYIGLVEGMVERFRQELGPAMRTIATGGLASRLAAATRVFDAVDPWLTLDGLRFIWELNQKEAARK